MSTIGVDNARPSAGGTSYSLTQGVAKVSLRYDQIANEVDDSENVSSVTDSTTGQFVVNYTNGFADTLFSPSQLSGILGSGVPGAFASQSGISTGNLQHGTYRLSGTNGYFDGDFNAILIHGDLA